MLQHCYLTSGCLSNLPLRGLTVQPRALAPGYLGPGSALQVAPDERCAPDCVCCLDVFLRLITSTANSLKLRPRTPLVRRFVLVLVVALVLDSLRAECWSTGVSEYCAFSELHPAAAGLEVLSGRFFLHDKPRTESFRPWAIIYNRFAVKSGNDIQARRIAAPCYAVTMTVTA
jgi:hypothetical protein